LNKLPKVSSSYLRHPQALKLQHEQAFLASFRYHVEKVNELANFAKIALRSIPTRFSKSYSPNSEKYQQALKNFSESKKMFDEARDQAKAIRAHFFGFYMWQPVDYTLRVITGMYDWGPYDVYECYQKPIFTNVSPMRWFLRDINNYPSTLQFKNSLDQMLYRNPDLIKEKWNATNKILKKVSTEVDECLAALYHLACLNNLEF